MDLILVLICYTFTIVNNTNMKHVLKVILLVAFLSNIHTTTKAQNVIMLKDRLYDTTFGSGIFAVPIQSEIYQARIIDGFIYTIETWLGTQGLDSWYYAKYDLNGNLIKRKRFPFNFNSSIYDNIIHEEHPTLQIFKLNANELLCYLPRVTDKKESYFFKYDVNLDSIKLVKKTISTTTFSVIQSPRKLIQTSDNNLLFLYIDTLATDYVKVALQKLDYNLNVIWTKDVVRDSNYNFQMLKYLSYFGKYDGITINEKHGEYFIAIPKYNSICNSAIFDPSCSTTRSKIDINVYKLNSDGIKLSVDSFNLGAPQLNLGLSFNVTNLNFTNNGYKLTTYRVPSGSPDSAYLIDIDTVASKVTFLSKIGLKCCYLTPQFLSKGYIDCNNYPTPKFYNFNSNYSSATLNQQSVKPIPDSFSMYYPNRFQKVVYYHTTWIDENIDTSYLLLGKITLQDSGTFLTIIPLSNNFGNYTGKIYKDNNKNCSFDNITDSPYKNRTVEITKTNSAFPYKYYNNTDDNGKFSFISDTGNFSAKVFPNSDLWSACPTTQTFALNSANDTVTQNFYLQKLVNCPKLSVSIATGRLRPCFENTYVVNYCNRGTADAVGATVQVLFDSAIAVNSASVSYSNIGNLYTFNVGTIKEDSCGQFTIATTLTCSTTVGLTHCVTAHIFPDSLCVSADARWNRANVTVDGQCLGDSVRFRIRNAGTGNMTQSKKYYVVEDHVLKVTPQNFILNAGQELQLKYLANGSTIRLVAEQVDFFPYPSNPTAVVENCGGLSPGFVNSFPNNDAADFIAINCTQSVGSFDPNDKNGVPEGVNDQHLIAKNTDIDYKIRFQNTGTDTAYDVYILDTLSSKLNVASLQMGAASHPYRYELYGDGIAILKVVFPNINLVDSFRNEPLSHGFFTYRIAQDSNVVEGDKILNKAAIYFDYNQPIITNTTLHTITTNFLRVITTVIENKWKATTNVYPNPFSDRCTIEIKTDKNVTGKFRFTLFDLKGQLIQEQFVTDNVELIANELPNNMYLFRIEKDGELISAGKVVKE